MGRLSIRWRTAAATLALALSATAIAPQAAHAFERFGPMRADSTYGIEMTFEVELLGGSPERLELLLRFGESEVDFVAPVAAGQRSASYRWDAAADHVVPNTAVSYRWRAHHGDRVTLSPVGLLRYADDRPGFDWRSERIGDAVVHWYGDADAQARRFGELTAVGARQAEELLGHEMAGPIDIFVYATRDDFFGALGPGAREWTGAAAYPNLRTVFMYLGGGSQTYLETAIVHEVTHVVFHDATDNPFHEPARWLNEGIATWSEERSAASELALVEFEARSGSLLAFEAITQQFPIGDRGGRLAYAQGTVMIDMIVREYGTDALARIAAEYRDGVADEEALEAGVGVPAEQLYAAFFATFGVDQPQAIEPAPMLASNVERPPSRMDDGGQPRATSTPPGPARPAEPSPTPADGSLVPFAVAAGLLVIGVSAAVLLIARRRRTGDAE